MGVHVRKAVAEDIGWCLGQLQACDRQYGGLYFHPQSRSLLESLIDHDVVLIGERDGQPAGLIVGALHPHFLIPGRTQLTTVALWVSPEHRGQGVAGAILAEFTQIGCKTAQTILVGAAKNSHLTDESLSRLGFDRQERVFLMEVS